MGSKFIVFVALLAYAHADHSPSSSFTIRRRVPSTTIVTPSSSLPSFIPSSAPISSFFNPTPPPPDAAHQTTSFRRFCFDLITNSTTGLGETVDTSNDGIENEIGDTIVARTVGEDGTSVSLENNPENVANNTVDITPVVFNIADVNLVVTDNGVAFFLPFDQVPVQNMLDGADMQKGGLELLLDPGEMPNSLGQCLHG